MQTIAQALKARALRILDHAKSRPVPEMLHASSVAARAMARACQLEGDADGFAMHTHMASKFAHLSEMRAKVHTQH